jgi:hypothetical protein
MESDSNRNEYAQETLASDRLRDTVFGVISENPDGLISDYSVDRVFC